MMKNQTNRDKSAANARAVANDAIDQAQAGNDVSDATKRARRERLTKYPPAVREARDQNEALDPNAEQRPDEGASTKPD